MTYSPPVNHHPTRRRSCRRPLPHVPTPCWRSLHPYLSPASPWHARAAAGGRRWTARWVRAAAAEGRSHCGLRGPHESPTSEGGWPSHLLEIAVDLREMEAQRRAPGVVPSSSSSGRAPTSPSKGSPPTSCLRADRVINICLTMHWIA